MTDPIADYLTRVRNATRANHRWVDIPASNLKVRISTILKKEGYIKDFLYIKDNKQGLLRIYLRYDYHGEPVIEGLERVSKPGRRIYVGAAHIPRVLNGLGIGIISTSKGVITDKEARKLQVGGEYLCKVW
jgi:small subunit ribosomal protein S8